MPQSRYASFIAVSGSLCVALQTSACALGTHGLTVTRITQTESAYVADSYSLGLQLRWRPDDAGLSLGPTHRTYVFPADIAGRTDAGWLWFFAPLPPERAITVHTRTLGLELGINGSDVGGTLGWQETATIAVDAYDDVLLRLDYVSGRPDAATVTVCRGNDQC